MVKLANIYIAFHPYQVYWRAVPTGHSVQVAFVHDAADGNEIHIGRPREYWYRNRMSGLAEYQIHYQGVGVGSKI